MNTWIEWILERQKSILYGFTGALLLTIVGFQCYGYLPHKEEIATPADVKAYAEWQKTPTDLEALGRWEQSIKKKGKLQKRFVTELAQAFFAVGKTSEALPYAELALKEKMESHPYFQRFAETTVLIEQGALQKALEAAKKLDSDMEEERQPGALLYAWNLLRIALLEKEAGSLEGERIAWDCFEAKVSPETATQISQTLSLGEISLKDYIAYRRS